MKKLTLLLSLLFISSFAFSQTNSVVLKDINGVVISQHSTIQAAYEAIPSSITQAYIIEILTDYNGSLEVFPITFNAKSGSSATNTITLRPALGNTGEIISGNSTSGILVLNDADFIIIDGRPGGVGNTPNLKIENLATTGTNSNTIALTNGATNNIIRFVHAVNNTQNTAGPRTIVLLTSSTVGNSNNLITNCKIEGGRSGVGIAGSSTYPNDSNTISNCEIFNWGYAGIWLVSGALNTNIDSCKIYQTVGVNNTIVSGIIMATMTGGTYNIRKNWIYDLQSTSTSSSTVIRGIYAAGPAAGSIFNVQNNMVSNTLDNSNVQTVTGIEFLGTNAYTANIYYNTTRIGGVHTGGTSGATTSAGIRIGASSLTLNMKNNICINYRTGGAVYHIGFVLVSTTGVLNVDYNCYFANGTNSFHAYWGGVGYNNLSDYKTAASPNEQNTVFANVNLVSATDLHLAGTSIGDTNLKGTPISGITTDFDNDLRNPIAPYKGADEGNVPLFVKINSTIVYDYYLSQNFPNPFNPSTTIKFSIAKDGFVTLKVFDILGRVVSELISQDMKAGEYQINFNANNLSSGIYFYRLSSDNFSETKQMIIIK